MGRLVEKSEKEKLQLLYVKEGERGQYKELGKREKEREIESEVEVEASKLRATHDTGRNTRQHINPHTHIHTQKHDRRVAIAPKIRSNFQVFVICLLEASSTI